jgi:hypothetical protein
MPMAPTPRETFERDGIVRVAGAIEEGDVRAMRACVQGRIAGLEVAEVAGALRPVRGTELAMWAIGRDTVFAPRPGALARAVDDVFGAGVWKQVEGEHGGLAMPNLPCPQARWSACDVAWHVDEDAPPGAPPGRVLIAYALLDVVEPGGGATVVLAGSHRNEEHPRLVELTGEAGDIIFLDPRCRHTISANVSTRARLVMRLTCVREEPG